MSKYTPEYLANLDARADKPGNRGVMTMLAGLAALALGYAVADHGAETAGMGLMAVGGVLALVGCVLILTAATISAPASMERGRQEMQGIKSDIQMMMGRAPAPEDPVLVGARAYAASMAAQGVQVTDEEAWAAGQEAINELAAEEFGDGTYPDDDKPGWDDDDEEDERPRDAGPSAPRAAPPQSGLMGGWDQ